MSHPSIAAPPPRSGNKPGWISGIVSFSRPALSEFLSDRLTTIPHSPDAAISIPESKLTLLNKSSSTQTFRHLPSSLGGGISGLPDVFHQLHCLDTVRQYTWLLAGNYGTSPATVAGELKQHPLIPVPPVFDGTSDVANRMHADHCIETLRKTLMCHADVTPLLILRDDNNPIGDRPDFNLHQKCRDWEAIREWTTRNWVTGREE